MDRRLGRPPHWHAHRVLRRRRPRAPLPQTNSYAAVIDHVLDCLGGRASSRLTPASVFEGLQLTLDVRDALTAQAR
jgi:hypothetical protein